MDLFLRGIWSEHVPYSVVQQPNVLGWLAHRSLRLYVAVPPPCLRELPSLLEACADHGVRVSLWPLVDDRHGRWLNLGNLAAFEPLVRRMLEVVSRQPGTASEVVFDLEPPIAATRALLRLEGRALFQMPQGGAAGAAEDRLRGWCGEVRRCGLVPSAVVPPALLCDPPAWTRGRGGWHRLLGLPAVSQLFDRVTVMAYTSLMEGYGRGFIGRQDVRVLLGELCQRARARWPGRAAVALGVTGGGALGDERPYRSVEELRDDMAIAQAAGIEEVSLFDLGGVLDQPGPQAWLDALVATRSASSVPQSSWRPRLLMAGAVGLGRLLAHRRPIR